MHVLYIAGAVRSVGVPGWTSQSLGGLEDILQEICMIYNHNHQNKVEEKLINRCEEFTKLQ